MHRCYTDEHHELELHLHPEIKETEQKIEVHYQQFLRKQQSMRNRQTTQSKIIIPVVVNLLYYNDEENLSDLQIQSQLDRINIDFAGKNGDMNKVPSRFNNDVAKTPALLLEFELHSVRRKKSIYNKWGTNDRVKLKRNGGIEGMDSNIYLNIWVAHCGDNILGYATFPGGKRELDGVVISNENFGDYRLFRDGYYGDIDANKYKYGRTGYVIYS